LSPFLDSAAEEPGELVLLHPYCVALLSAVLPVSLPVECHVNEDIRLTSLYSWLTDLVDQSRGGKNERNKGKKAAAVREKNTGKQRENQRRRREEGRTER
jgi:hypothetical protein